MGFTDALNTEIKLQCYHNINGECISKWATFPFKKKKNPMKYLIDTAWAKQDKFNSALIYKKGSDIPIFKLLDGILLSDKSSKVDSYYYGADISKYKLKIKLDTGLNLLPIYSNILHSDEHVYINFINRYIRTIFKDNLANALIFLNKEEKLVAQIKNNRKGDGFMFRSAITKEYTDIDKLFPTTEQYIFLKNLKNDFQK